MEILRKEILIISLLLTLSAISNFAAAQDYAKLQTAFSKSYTYESNGEYAKAFEAIKSIYEENSYEINLRMGWVAYLNGLYTESLSYYQKATLLMPLSIEAKLGIIYPANALNNTEIIKTQYIDILKIDPKNSIANYRLGCIYYGKGDYTSAYKYLEVALNLYPFDYDINLMCAWTNFKLGKLREAKVLFNKTLMIRPNDASALEGLSLIK